MITVGWGSGLYVFGIVHLLYNLLWGSRGSGHSLWLTETMGSRGLHKSIDGVHDHAVCTWMITVVVGSSLLLFGIVRLVYNVLLDSLRCV